MKSIADKRKKLLFDLGSEEHPLSVVEANEGRQPRRQEQCSCAEPGLQGHPEPQSKQKRDWTLNLECQIFRDLF